MVDALKGVGLLTALAALTLLVALAALSVEGAMTAALLMGICWAVVQAPYRRLVAVSGSAGAIVAILVLAL